MNGASIKYGFWAQMAMWPMVMRAAIIIGFLAICAYILLRILYPGIICQPIRFLDWLLKGIFWVAAKCREQLLILSGVPYLQRAERINRILAAGDHLSTKLGMLKSKVARKKKGFVGLILILYMGIILLIALPDLLRDKIADQYLPAFSVVRDWYSHWESNKLEAAEGYAPLFKDAEKTVPQTTEAIETTESEVEETDSQIRLTLSKKGWGGANIREEASAKSGIIVSISGEVELVYIGEENGWVNVRLEDGTEGWIKKNLVEGLLEE